MSKVEVTYEMFEPKKHSVRLKTDERLDGQFPLPDLYVRRDILTKLGITSASAQDSTALRVKVTYEIAA